MPAYSFSVFKEKVKDGSKAQTVRHRRKYPTKVGDWLALYWKQRSPECEKLGESVCTETFPIFKLAGWWNKTYSDGHSEMMVEDELTDIALRDGFDTVADFEAWFADVPDSEPLDVIRWKPLGGVQ